MYITIFSLSRQLLFGGDKLILTAAYTKLCSGFDGVGAVSGFHALYEVRLAGVIAGVDKVNAGLIYRDGIGRNEHAHVLYAGVLRHSAAVAVDGHVLHNVHIQGVAAEVLHNGGRSVRHRLEERVMVSRPEVVRIADAVDILLAVGGGDAYRQLLECSAVAARGVALEVREDEHRIILVDILADVILLDLFAVGDIKHLVGAFRVHYIDVEIMAPAVQLHGLPVVLGGVAPALVSGVALDDSSADMVDDGLPEFGTEEVLVADLTGVYLDGYIAGEIFSCQLNEFYYLFGTDSLVKLYL